MARRFSPETLTRPAPQHLQAGTALPGLWRRLEPYVGGNGWRLAVFGVVSLLSGIAEALLLYAVVRTAAALAAEEELVAVAVGPLPSLEASVGQLFFVSFVLVAVMLVLAVVSARLASRMSVTALTNARLRTFDAFLHASWDLQGRERGGHLQELLTTNVKRVATGVTVITGGLTAGLAFTVFLVTALLVSPVAAATILVGVAVLYALLRPLIRLTRSSSRQHVGENASYAMSVTQAARLAREIRAFDVTAPVGKELAAQAEQVGRVSFVTRFLGQLAPKVYQGAGLFLVVTGMLVAYRAEVGDLADLGVVILLLVRALANSQQLQSAIQQASEVAPYAEDLRHWQDRYRGEAVHFGEEDLQRVRTLRFCDVSFAYEPGCPVLSGVDLEIYKNETIGVIGPSGAGKSTLVQLLLRLRAPSAGEYLVNGRPAASFNAASWSRQLTFVPQDNQLVRGSVADNIRFHRTWVDDFAIERAARLAHLHEEIIGLPDSYGTMIGSGAMDLSGGQRQRLGLARALAGSPSMLVLDEPTSALDVHSEQLIQQTFEEMRGALTLVIAAHRMTTLQRCDRIMVLGHGGVEAFGTPIELASCNDFYRDALRLSGILS